MAETVLERPRFAFANIDEAFPTVDAGLIPFGSRVLCQLRAPRKVTAGGILVPEDTQETEFWNTQVAKIITLGPVAFKNRETLEGWPEGDWCREGTFVRTPKFGGDKFFRAVPGASSSRIGIDRVLFQVFNDLDLIGEITCDPLEVVAYL